MNFDDEKKELGNDCSSFSKKKKAESMSSDGNDVNEINCYQNVGMSHSKIK